ncbi:MAG: electron transporter RnfD [Oscillospiraceae bacterium]|nr:electron transporter RnfD [Oscillospiraceae bacterium]
MKILHNDRNVLWMGRRDVTENETRLFHAGAQAVLRFKGTKLDVTINNCCVWGSLNLGVVVDGEVKGIPLSHDNNCKDVTLTVAENLADGVHDVIIYKRHAGNQYLFIKDFETDGEFIVPDALPERKIEVYGDSVCAGEVIEAYDYVAQCDPEGHDSKFDNVWNSFVMQTARNIDAQIHNICQGGIALFDKTGYFHMPDCIGLESTYDKTCYFPEGGDITTWDFSRYTPDIVIIAIGQNDQHNAVTDQNDRNISDPVYRNQWKTAYIKMVRDLDKHYGGAKFVLTTTILMHDVDWDNAIEEIKDELNGMGIKTYHNMFSRNGAATPGHPRLSEHNEMAEELTEFIKKNVL